VIVWPGGKQSPSPDNQHGGHAVVESDIKLVPGQVRVEAWDLVLDAKDRRKKQTPQRRALVHDFDDGLTVNWDNDYPHGVTMKGVRTIEGKNLGPVTKTEFQHAVDFRGWVDHFAKLRFVASKVRWTQISNDKQDRLVIENKGLPKPADIVFRSPVVTHKVGQNGPLEVLLTAKPDGSITKGSKVTDDQFASAAGTSHVTLMLSIAGQTPGPVDVKVDAIDAIATLSDLVRKLRLQVQALEGSVGQVDQLSQELADVKAQLTAAQAGWRWCHKCQGLFFAASPATENKPCPTGGQHSQDGSGNYRLVT
jgi:hypothetical protein